MAANYVQPRSCETDRVIEEVVITLPNDVRTKGGMHHDPILMRVYLAYDATYRARIVIIDAINPTQLA